MRWIGLNEGYVSGDGRFLVAHVTVQGQRAPVQQWALYGLVHVRSDDPARVPWVWTEQPIFGPKDTKRACQDWAVASEYEPGLLELSTSTSSLETPTDRPVGYEICQECVVQFSRKAAHLYEDYCGHNCFQIVCERVEEIRENLNGRSA
jgi:hypothetical protein